MRKMLKVAIAAGALAGLAPAFFEGTAVAAPFRPIVFKAQGADPNDLARVNEEGRLRKTDEEFTNEQGTVAFFGDGKAGLFVEMRTGALSTGEEPQHRMQAACTPFGVTQDQATGLVGMLKSPGERFITDNDGNEYRNANKPQLTAINNGRNMLVTFNYQPNGTNDTRRYAKVLNADCTEVPLVNGNGEPRKQIQIMAKNNDDCDMHQTGEGPCDIASDAGGVTHLACWAGCNGNGQDDGWLNDLTVECQNGPDGLATGCTVRKNFDLSLAAREERSRGRCSIADEDPNTAICTWTEGNNQPQRDGTWIAAVDISPDGEQGENAQSRLLWKEQYDGRKGDGEERTYSVRAMHTRVLEPQPDGSLRRSTKIFMRAGDLRGNNQDNRKGGAYYGVQIAVINATREGMTYVTPKTDLSNMLLGIDGTHLTMCGAVAGQDTMMPAFTLMQGSHNGGGVTEPNIKTIAWDPTTMAFSDLGTARGGGSYDRHMYSNYLGNNPGNQGRNFAGCTLTKNPYFGLYGNLDRYFVAHAMTGKDPLDLANPALKPSSFVTLLPVNSVTAAPVAPEPTPTPTTPPSTPAPSTPPGTPAPTSPTAPAPSTPEPAPASNPSVGCSAAPGSSSTGAVGGLATLALLGLAVSARRKRS